MALPGTATALVRPSLLSALLFGFASGIWWVLEVYAQQRFDAGQLPEYNMKIESLSDLGVDYRQVHPLKHYNVQSWGFTAMNFDFIIAGALYGLGNLDLIWSTRRSVTSQTAMFRTIRFLLSLATAGGFILVATIHGGPREKFWGIIGWHWLGMSLATIGGNLNSLIIAVRPTVGVYENYALYRLYSLSLGITGLYSYYRFLTIGEWDFESPLGLWQRGSIYPIVAWQGVTAIAVVIANLTSRLGKGKTA